MIVGDLIYMFMFWGLGVFTGLGLGVSLGVDRYIKMQRQLEESWYDERDKGNDLDVIA
jgi:hypothetical protein